MITKGTLFALFFAMAFELTRPAYAYLDPGTGSMLLQMLLGGVAGALAITRIYWQRFRDFFGRVMSKLSRGSGGTKK
jgi:hypothetical protein